MGLTLPIAISCLADDFHGSHRDRQRHGVPEVVCPWRRHAYRPPHPGRPILLEEDAQRAGGGSAVVVAESEFSSVRRHLDCLASRRGDFRGLASSAGCDVSAFAWFAYVLLPLSVLCWGWWITVVRAIRRDMHGAHNRELLRNGIPHHGILVVIAIQTILTIGLWVIQVIVSIRLGQQASAIVFGAANVITNMMLITGVQLMARVERGHLTRRWIR